MTGVRVRVLYLTMLVYSYSNSTTLPSTSYSYERFVPYHTLTRRQMDQSTLSSTRTTRTLLFPPPVSFCTSKYNTLQEPTTCRLFVMNCASGIDGQEKGVGKVQEGGNTARYEAINGMDESRRAGGSDWNGKRRIPT